jgi:hypothetical protein
MRNDLSALLCLLVILAHIGQAAHPLPPKPPNIER